MPSGTSSNNLMISQVHHVQMDVSNLSSNWKKLQASLKQIPNSKKTNGEKEPSLSSSKHGVKRKRTLLPKGQDTANNINIEQSSSRNSKRLRPASKMSNRDPLPKTQHLPEPTITSAPTDTINGGLNADVEVGKYLAIDCEMVGIGPPPHLESILARVSIVNYNGDCVYDSYVKPLEPVTDWRTHVSGIAPKHMLHARSFEEVQADVAALIKNTVLVGHSIRGDFNVLLLSHPMRDIRDTARHPPYRKLAGGGSPKLKILASELLGLAIQAGEHSSIEDARATMLLFRRDKDAFEREHAKKWPTKVVSIKENGHSEQSKKTKKKKKRRR